MLFEDSKIVVDSPEKVFYLFCVVVVILCVFSILMAVLIDFVEFQERKKTKNEKKSLVETGTMMGFFLFFYALIRFGVGQIYVPYSPLKIFIMSLGLVLLILGCVVNIEGRLKLGRNWANQIKIYHDHYLVSDGVYAWVRHPLYASLIWMFWGSSLVFFNPLAFLANGLIFMPSMYYRAKQEEGLLMKEFRDYKNYKMKVGMFFPKSIKKYEKV
jgi:protein-S-isoprenylcysteine O-methyltransferase Ste14